MSEDRNSVRPPRGPMGGGRHAAMRPGEKAKDFKGTLVKLLKYMRVSLPAIILSLLFAAASVVLTLNIPKLLGSSTDKLIEGFMQRQIYDETDAMVRDNQNIPYDSISALAYAEGISDFNQLFDVLEEKGVISASQKAEYEKSLGDYAEGVLSMSLYERPSIDVDAIIKLLTVITVLIFVSAAVSYAQSFILAGVAQRTSYRLRRDIDVKINKLPLKYYDGTTNGNVLSYLTNDVDSISTTLNQSLSQLISSITTIVGVLVMMISISWIMAGVAVLIVPVSLALIATVVKFSQKYFRRQQAALAAVNGHIEEMYAGNKVIQLYNRKDESVAEFAVYNKELTATAQKSQFLSGLMHPIMNFVGNIGYVLACVIGGVLTASGKITVGDIQAFVTYIRQFNQPIGQVANIANTLQSTVAAAERVFGFLEAEDEKETGDAVPQSVKGDVEFCNVHFGYDPDKIIIKDFSCSVKAGQKIAIVGPTGAGKTTVVKLLMRYYDLSSGKILLDGRDIADYKRSALREEFGMVLQDTWLYSGTVMDNIRYGRLDATDEEVIAAAKLASADHFIRTLDGGFDFVINEEADNISQGQKQLLTIARALLSDPKVLILDEATSSVDTRTEQLIQNAMITLMEGRTSFIIAHRLSTITNADKILVMRDGDIVEQGTHAELMEKKGFYEQLYSSQFEH